MPRCLAHAGFEVSILAPHGSLAGKSRFVKKIGAIAVNTTAAQWMQAFAAIVNATSPDLVLPCDDTSFRLMQNFVYSPPALPREQLRGPTALVTASLGNPSFYRTSVDKTLLCPAAEALGVRVPPHRLVAEAREAEAFVAEHGYPVVLKRGHSTAGEGVAICSDRTQIAAAFANLTRSDSTGLPDAQGAHLLAQAYIRGKIRYYAGVAWKGELVSGMAVEKLAGDLKGPSSVSRYFRCDELRDASARLAGGFEMSGIFAPEFAIDARTGEAYLLELNRRMTHGTHRGEAVGVDAGAALYAAVRGTPVTTRTDLDQGEEHLCVHFPGEWVRDPESRWLTDHPVDVPWDDPELLEAMVALRRVL